MAGDRHRLDLDLSSWAQAGADEEVDHRSDDHQHGHQLVHTQAEHEVGLVRAEQLQQRAGRAVHGEVQGERPAVPEPEPSVGPDDDAGGGQAPQRLVQERRVKGLGVGVLRRPVLGVDAQSPGQVGGGAVDLLVGVVAPPSERLTDGHPRGQGIGEGRERDAAPTAGEPGAQGAAEQPPEDGQTALPDPDDLPGILARTRVVLQVRQHVEDPGPDDARRDGPHQDVHDRARLPAPGDPPPVGQPAADEDAGEDEQRVRPDRHDADVPGPLGGRRDAG